MKRTHIAAVNHGGFDPLQGYDAEVFVIDQASAVNVLAGRFMRAELVIRNATMPYLTFNQRIARLLDGDVQLAWTLERGMLDTRVLWQSFGYTSISRFERISRNSRFNITFNFDAPELKFLDGSNGSRVDTGARSNNLQNGELFIGGAQPFQSAQGTGHNHNYDNVGGQSKVYNNTWRNRRSSGQVRLGFCKLDTFAMVLEAGRSIVANRWDGMAESYEVVDNRSLTGNTDHFGDSVSAADAIGRTRAFLDHDNRLGPTQSISDTIITARDT